MERECWYKNVTKNDILLNDLGIKIPAEKVINIFKIKPSLSEEEVVNSERNGLIKVCVNFKPIPKLVKLPAAPFVEISGRTEITEAKSFLPSRAKTSVSVNQHEKDYVEDMEEDNVRLSELNLEQYAGSLDGTADPMKSTTKSGKKKKKADTQTEV